MIIENEVEYKVNGRSLKYYRDLGYDCKVNDLIKVKIEDLKQGSSSIVHYKCDRCGNIIEIPFKNFTGHHSIHQKTFCVKCSNDIRIEKENLQKEEFLAKNGLKKCHTCNRILPANTDYYFKKHDTKDGFVKKCKECMGYSFTDHLTKIPKEGYAFCKKCGRELPHTSMYFPTDKGCKTGLRYICRECNDHYKNFLSEDFIPNKRWTSEEDNLLRLVYHYYTGEEIKEQFFPNRTIRAIECRADMLNTAYKTKETYDRARKIAGVKTGEKLKGHEMPFAIKQKISERKKEYFKTHDAWWKGKHLSIDQRQKISERNTRLGKWKGNKNPRFINPLKGSDNPNWAGGLTNLYEELRSEIKEWVKKSANFCNYNCIISGINFDNIHHIVSFKNIVDEVFSIVKLNKQKVVADYSEEEFKKIRKVLIDLHMKYGFGACVNKEIHKLFHDTYGYKNFSPCDFLDFVYRVDSGDFDKWFTSHNIPININYDYIEYLESTLYSLGIST